LQRDAFRSRSLQHATGQIDLAEKQSERGNLQIVICSVIVFGASFISTVLEIVLNILPMTAPHVLVKSEVNSNRRLHHTGRPRSGWRTKGAFSLFDDRSTSIAGCRTGEGRVRVKLNQ